MTTTRTRSKKPAAVTAPVAVVNDQDAVQAPTGILSQLSAEERAKLAHVAAASPSLGISDDRDAISSPAQYDCGETVFEVFEDFGSAGQVNCWRSIANTALATAIYAANNSYALQEDEYVDDERVRAAQYRTSLYSDLYFHALEECRTLSESKYDQPMDVEGMFKLLTTGEVQVNDQNEAIFEATLKAMDVGAAEASALRETRKKELLKQAIKQQTTLRDRKAEVIDEVNRGSAYFNPDRFTAPQHLAFFKKVHANLRKASAKALTFIGRYDDAASDAMSFADDAKRVDKAMVAFRRRNKADLALTEERSAD